MSVVSFVRRLVDSTGTQIKGWLDSESRFVQAAALTDGDGEQAGIAGNPLVVDGSAVTQPVSIASMPTTPVTGTFWQATQPVSAASLPLPNGAATESSVAAWGTNNVDEASATVTYVGQEKSDGTWRVMKIDTSSGTAITYAAIGNNSLVTTYASAWAARVSLTYGTYGSAF
jgi:hypothetical protein